ncbi:MAG: hypothetical protein GYB51_16710 [Rhodobacteraceae bacterium]|nr:hypothetical protein [Paracoccaceae bacterium]
MFKLIYTSTFFILLAVSTAANPWKVQEGSTLLDGTETATYVAGYLFSGKDYEFTSSQINLRCADKELVMSIIGDSDLLTKAEAQNNPTVELIIKLGSELASFKATIENVDYGRERARVHNGPELLELLRQHDGSSSQVQLPVARTGVPEVRKLSLENVVKTTDLALATCGPLKVWEVTETAAVNPLEEPTASTDEPPMDLEIAVRVGMAQKLVEELMRNRDVTFEQIAEALKPLANMTAE